MGYRHYYHEIMPHGLLQTMRFNAWLLAEEVDDAEFEAKHARHRLDNFLNDLFREENRAQFAKCEQEWLTPKEEF